MLTLLLLAVVLSPALASQYSLVGRYAQSDDEGVQVGWPGSGISFDTPANAKISLSLSLPSIKWYDAKGQLEDGARMAVFIDGVFTQDHLVIPTADGKGESE